MLPSPDQEDIFLANLPNDISAQEDPQHFVQSLIQEAIEAKRPRFAGQLFTHLPNPNSDDPATHKAQQALRMMLIDAPDAPSQEYWETVEAQWAQIEFTKPGHRLRTRHHPRAQQDPRNQYGTRAWRRRR